MGDAYIIRQDKNALLPEITAAANIVSEKTTETIAAKEVAVTAAIEASNYAAEYPAVNLESTGYGIISGGDVTFSGLTGTITAVVAHMQSGKRYSKSQTIKTANTADATNSRIDLIYIDSNGVIQYLAGTPATSPVVPILPSGAISLRQFTVAANATSITNDTDTRVFKNYIFQTNILEIYSSQRLQNAINFSTCLRIQKGNYVIDKTIKIPSNRTIIIEDGATITLKDGCNQYIFENEDTVNGNENIYIYGGIYEGKGQTMTRIFGTTLQNSYYGFGFHFHKVTNLHVKHVKIYHTNAWAIAHMNCNYVYFDDVYVWQNEGQGLNSDGITGQSSNLHISNVSGYTNDDMVAILAYGANLGANTLHYDANDEENITVNNITTYINGGTATWKAVALYQQLGKNLSNVSLSNIKGQTYESPILIWGNDNDTIHFKGISIENVKCEITRAVGVICVSNGVVDNLNINNVERNSSNSYAEILIKGESDIQNINISNVSANWDNVGGEIIYDTAHVQNINFSNIASLSKTLNTTRLYTKDRSDSKYTTKIRANNINLNGTDANTLAVKPLNGSKISINSIAFLSDRTQLTPFTYDIINDKQYGIMTYYTIWQNANSTNIATRVYLGTAQTATSTLSKLVLDTVDFDLASSFDSANKRFIAPKSGLYHVDVSVAYQLQTDGNKTYLELWVNGVSKYMLAQQCIGKADYSMSNGSSTIALSSGDYVELYVYSANNVGVVATSKQTSMCIYKV